MFEAKTKNHLALYKLFQYFVLPNRNARIIVYLFSVLSYLKRPDNLIWEEYEVLRV